MRLPRTTPDELLLVTAAACIGFGDYYAYGAFTPRSLKLVAVGCILVGAAMLLPRVSNISARLAPHVAVVVLVVWQGLTLVRATAIYGRGHALSDARYLSIAMPMLAVAAILTVGVAADWWWRLLLAGFAVGCVATIRASPQPSIDVWYLLQHASDCVLRDCNPYTLHTPQAPGVQEGFPYLPMTAVLLAPFRLLFGDVRYGEALAVVVAAAVLRRCGTGRTLRLSPLLLGVPGLFFQIEQAWTESILLPLLVAAAALALADRPDRRRWIASGVLLGLALGSKQHMWLLLPVAWLTLGRRITLTAAATGAVTTLPWLLADPSAMWRDTVTEFVHIAPRVDALTLWLHEPLHLRSALAPLVVALAYVLVWLCCRDLPHRFLLGAGAVLAGFDLMNKQSFYNQWVLVAWLLIAAAALTGQPRAVSIGRREEMTRG